MQHMAKGHWHADENENRRNATPAMIRAPNNVMQSGKSCQSHHESTYLIRSQLCASPFWQPRGHLILVPSLFQPWRLPRQPSAHVRFAVFRETGIKHV